MKKTSEPAANPRLAFITTVTQTYPITRSGLYRLHKEGKPILVKNGRRTLVDLQILEKLLAELPPA